MTRPPKRPIDSRGSRKERPELEGAGSDERGDPDVPRVVPPSESANGGIDYDDRGHASWKWNADVDASDDPDAQTFNYLKALETDLEIEQSQQVRVLDQSTKTGINPYDTACSKKPK